jgi:ferrous iron transport protein B
LRDSLLDPLGLDIGDISDADAAAAEQGITEGVFGAMVSRFDGQAGAFAYLLFVLLYFPCVATIGAIKREAGRTWATFVAGWTTLVAYITASSFYQIARFDAHPESSTAWLLGMWLCFALVIFVLRRWEQRSHLPAPKPVQAEA